MKRKWTRGEKWLWATPLIFIVGAGAAVWGPNIVRRGLGRPQRLELRAGDQLASLALSRDGSILAATLNQPAPSHMPAQVNFWDARTLKPLKPLGACPPAGTRRASNFALALAPDGKWVTFASPIAGNKQSFALYERATQRACWRINGYFYNSAARFAPDGQTLVVARSVKNVCQVLLLRVRNGQVLAQWHSRIYNDVMQFVWSPDGKTLACSGAFAVTKTPENFRGVAPQIEIRRARDGKLLRHWFAPFVQSLDFSPDGSRLIVVNRKRTENGRLSDFQAVAFDVATARVLWRYGTGKNEKSNSYFFLDARFSPDGKLVAAISNRGTQVLLINAQTGALERTLNLGEGISSSLTNALAFSPDGKRLYARGTNAVLVWDLD